MRGERGQLMVLFALIAPLLIIVAGLSVNGNYDLLQQRQAQNAADLGSEATAELLANACTGSGGSVSGATVSANLDQLISENLPDGNPNFSYTGYYLNSGGSRIGVFSSTSNPPSGACQLSLQLTTSWKPILGIGQGQSVVDAIASYQSSGQGRLS